MAFRINKTKPGDRVRIMESMGTRSDLIGAVLEIIKVEKTAVTYHNHKTGDEGQLLWNTLVERAR